MVVVEVSDNLFAFSESCRLAFFECGLQCFLCLGVSVGVGRVAVRVGELAGEGSLRA